MVDAQFFARKGMGVTVYRAKKKPHLREALY
jgi:hypothetical protein